MFCRSSFLPLGWKTYLKLFFQTSRHGFALDMWCRKRVVIRYLLREHFDKLNTTLGQLHLIALRNLSALPSTQITFANVSGGAEGFIRADDNFAAVRILLTEVRARFASKLGDEFLSILPHRDDCF